MTGTFILTAIALLHCGEPPVVVLTPSSGGQGGTAKRDASAGGNAGNSDDRDAMAVAVKLDVLPVWWGTSDVPQGPETTAPSLDSNCGQTSRETVRKPADILLLLDGSASMEYSIPEDCYCERSVGNPVCTDTTDCKSRLDAIKPAVTATLASSKYVNWGLKIFPTSSGGGVGIGMINCNVSRGMDVEVAADSATDIQEHVDTMSLTLGTPTAAAIEEATAYLKSLDDGNQKFILLATDGEPNCKNGNIQTVDVDGAETAAAAAKAAGFPVYVVGIGPNLENLSAIAAAGGTEDYYPVTSPEQLVEALSSISKFVGSCTYTMEEAPPDAENVAVYVNKERINKSDSEGWTYGDSTQEIVLTGSYCEAILAGEETAVQILFGCPGEPPFPLFVP